MSTHATKPWSMDEGTDVGAETPPDSIVSETDSAALLNPPQVHTAMTSSAATSPPSRFSATTLLLLGSGLAILAVTLLAVFKLQHAWTLVALVAILNLYCVVLLGASPQSRNAVDSHATVNPSMGHVSTTLATEPSSNLQPLWNAVEEQTSDIKQRLDAVLGEHAQMSLELTLATTQKRHVNAILDAISDPLLVIDSFNQLQLANPAAATLLQFDRVACLRKPITDALADRKLVALLQHAREADSRAGRRRVEYRINDRTFTISIKPLPAESDQARHGIVALFRDITRDREASRQKSDFVAHAAHELRTPLSSIRAYVEMLVDGEASDEKTRAEYYDIIQTSANRLGRMIDNILDISRIEAGTVRINKEPVAVSMFVKEAADTMRPQAEKKNITLTEELAPVVDRILADKDLMQQAILNLISNAIKYTPDGGSVHVRMVTQSDARKMKIEVSDSGAGIPREDLPRMFEKFFRVEANKSLASGTGLGLNLVKQIVENVHGGEMTVTSEVGKGSMFVITLPLYEGS